MRLLLIDFETAYDPASGYSLKTMPTLQYVRDSRFECLGVALDDEWHDGPATAEALAAVDWSDTICCAHNASFDGAVLFERFGHSPAYWLDTLAWTRYAIAQGALPPDAGTSIRWWGEFTGMTKGDTAQAVAAGGEALAEYGLQDVRIMRQALDWLQTHCPLPALEASFIDLHVRMATEPALLLDVPMLAALAADTLDPAIAKAVRSRDKFAAALVACGVTPGTKTSPANGKETYAFAKTDAFMRDLARHPDPVVRTLAELKAQGGSTIVASRSQRLLDVGTPLPVPLRYYGAHTGRSSGEDKLNMQNLPRGDFRKALVAPAGQTLIVADYSQIEARVVAWGAGDEAALEPFVGDRDPYKVVAARDLYTCAYDEVTKEQRQRAKAAVLALGFGQGANGFITYCEMFGIDMAAREAERIVQTWRHTRPRLVAWWDELLAEVLDTGELTLPSGRKLTYPGIERQGRQFTYLRPQAFSKRKGGDRVNLWHGLVAENWTQAVARDIIALAAVSMPVRVLMMVHDEIVSAGQEADVPLVERTMLTLPGWAAGLPVACEIETGPTYGDAK